MSRRANECKIYRKGWVSKYVTELSKMKDWLNIHYSLLRSSHVTLRVHLLSPSLSRSWRWWEMLMVNGNGITAIIIITCCLCGPLEKKKSLRRSCFLVSFSLYFFTGSSFYLHVLVNRESWWRWWSSSSYHPVCTVDCNVANGMLEKVESVEEGSKWINNRRCFYSDTTRSFHPPAFSSPFLLL